MSTVAELVEAHRRALRDGPQPVPGPPVLVQAAGVEEVVLPRLQAAPPSAWRTERFRRSDVDAAVHARERVERMMALQELVGDGSAVLPLTKSSRNPSPHVLVGRAKRNDVIIADTTVSSLHAQIEEVSDGMLVRDQGSSNGTFLNRRPLGKGEGMVVMSGDCLRLGRQVFYYLSGERLLLLLELRIVRGGQVAPRQ
jgi:hypothetical protein